MAAIAEDIFLDKGKVPNLNIDSDLKSLIPAISEAELEALEQSLTKEGCRDPLIVWLEENTLLDGHNRYEICRRLGIEVAVLRYSMEDRLEAQIWMRRNQVARRNLTDDQRAVNAARLVLLETEKSKRDRAKKAGEKRSAAAKRDDQGKMMPSLLGDVSSKLESTDEQPEPRKRDTPKRTQISKESAVSERKVKNALEIEKADPDLLNKVEAGEIKLSDATREIKRKAVIENLESVAVKEAKELAGEYDVIVIDPPWPMKKIERDERPNQSEFEYPTMTEEELAAMKMPAASDCHLWLWTTQKFMPMAFRLLDAWDFKYTCTFVWHKPGGFQPIGLPQYNAEFALYARKGAPKFIDTKAFNTCFEAPRGKHSEKPEEFYEVVRRVTAGRRIDIFNRRAIEGFDVYGKEAG